MEYRIPEPAVKRTTLVITAGITWMLVGIFLLLRGFINFEIITLKSIIITITAVFLGYLKARLIFYRIIEKNITRIKQLAPEKEKICIFAFQAIQSYLIVIFMILLGWILRRSPLDPYILSFIYILIGFALMISSIKYFQSSKQFTQQGENHY